MTIFCALLSLSWAAAPPIPYAKLQELSLCYEGDFNRCYNLIRKSPSDAKEIYYGFQGSSETKISSAEFESKARAVIEQVHPPPAATVKCSPRLSLRLKIDGSEATGYFCPDAKNTPKWKPYFR